MSNSYVIGIAVGIAFGIMFVALVSYYLKKRGRGIDQYDERQKLAQLKGWRAAFAASACFNIINAAVVDRHRCGVRYRRFGKAAQGGRPGKGGIGRGL